MLSLSTVAIFACVVNYTYATTVSSDQCGQDEVPTSCYEAVCERRLCSDLFKSVACVRIDPALCTNGCLCKSGYLRDENGICVPVDQCPNQCGQNEVPTSCYEAVCERRLCSDLFKSVACVRIDPAFCTKGCLCKSGYLRDENGICVPIDQCPNIRCGKNEIFDVCPLQCPGERCGVDPRLVLCLPGPQPGDPDCNPGCRCQDNYFRNEYGYCVPQDQCPKRPEECGPNEVVSDGYKPECQCRDGWLRAENGTCIPAEQCPRTCGKNAIYDICPANCPPETCDTVGRKYKCKAPPQPGDPECKPRCRCAKGFYKNKQGVCIPKEQCPKPVICGADEEYNSCVNGGCGRWNCSQPGIICLNLIEGACREGCRCKKGLLRTEEGTCVPADQCPLNCYGENEVRGCKSTCSPQTCESIGKKINCPLQPAVCTPECRCKDGFFRNLIGECISKENCLKCTGPNEYFSCGVACDNVCATLATQSKTNCPIDNIVCNPMCYCLEGYARDCNNTCVPISECPKPICGKNEIYDICPATCPPKTCDTVGREYKCKAPPQPGDPECKPGCRCADGFYKNKQGVCIPKEQCPKPVICGADEEYNSCVNGGCGRWNCSQPGIICIDPIKGGCREGCRCKKGLLRTDEGTCVPADQCPLNCYGENEVRGCKSTCSPQTCESIGEKINCPLQPAVCTPECRCKDGFFRNRIGECISKENCLKCTGPNEYFSCGVACDNVCATLATQSKTNCPIVNIVCNPMCYCLEGYARDDNNTCVPISECPKPDNQNTNGLKEFEEGNVAFTEKLLYEAALADPGKSIIISPFSVLFLLAQLALYATGTSLQQLLRLLNLDSKAKIRSVVPNYLDTLGSQQNVTFNLVEKIYANWNYALTEDFKKDTKEVFKAEAQNLDFCKSSDAAKVINEWVALNTNNLIQNLISPSSLNCDTVLVMANAIYFKGNWKYPFDPANTIKADFYVDSTNSVKVNIMRRSGSYKYAEVEDIDAQVIELPYKSDDFSLLICLPKNKDGGINDLINKLKDSNYSITNSVSSLESTSVDVSIPSFNSTTTADLKELLMKLKLDALFDPKTSGLTGILENSQPTYVSSAIEKATIIVNELGSEAAAANAVGVSATAVQLNKIYFIADSPFIYYILYKGTPIFCGIYYGD